MFRLFIHCLPAPRLHLPSVSPLTWEHSHSVEVEASHRSSHPMPRVPMLADTWHDADTMCDKGIVILSADQDLRACHWSPHAKNKSPIDPNSFQQEAGKQAGQANIRAQLHNYIINGGTDKNWKIRGKGKKEAKHGLLHHTTINNCHGYERGSQPPMQSSVVQSINREACLAVMTSMPPTDY